MPGGKYCKSSKSCVKKHLEDMICCHAERTKKYLKNVLNKRSGLFQNAKSKFDAEDGKYLTKITHVNRTILIECPHSFWDVNQMSLSLKKTESLKIYWTWD